ncbi:E3 ubiquitin-protein ligase TRIM45-like [Mytilus trossulus]|uniref:E3 ubiquitin-protein ligase TRIM45-like n=1 Tax=Mytilus trossulus TaxID=6551 RepID=UPI0030046AAF
MAQVASKTCDICTSAPEQHFCIDCEQKFCDNCKVLHTRQKATRQHKFQRSSELQKNGNYKCREHDEDYIFICKTCDAPVCSHCMEDKEGKHKEHEMSNIKETISSWNTIVKEEIETTLQEDIRILNELEKAIDTYDIQVKSVIEGIRGDEKKIKRILNKKIKSMIADVKLKTSCEKDKMVNLVTSTKYRIQTKADLEDRRKHLEKDTTNAVVLFNMKTLHSKFSEIGNEVLPSFSSIEYKLKEISELDLLSLFVTFRPLSDNLPEGIEMRRDKDGNPYYVYQKTNTITRDLSLPPGWEKRYTLSGCPYYVDHETKISTWKDPGHNIKT